MSEIQSDLQRQLNDDSCNPLIQVEVEVQYTITCRYKLCVPVSQYYDKGQQIAEIDSKIRNLQIPVDLTGEMMREKINWRELS